MAGNEHVVYGHDKVLDERIKPGSVSVAVTLHDTNEVTFNDPSDGDSGTTKYCRGFHCNSDGVLKCLFAQDSTERTINVKDGQYYPYSIKIFKSTGSTVGNNLVAIR